MSKTREVRPGTVARVRTRGAERGGHEAILPAQASAVRQRRLDGHHEADLIALACRAPPDGGVRWTWRMLAEPLVAWGSVETVSHETVRQVLLAKERQPWIKKPWGIPTQPDAQFVSHREEVLSVSTRPSDPRDPHVCRDESTTQRLTETRDPLPMEPGKPKREDDEDKRQGVWNIVLAGEPLAGQRSTMVAAQRTTQEWAEFLCCLSDESDPQAENITLVMDTLKTHILAALSDVFPMAEARRLAQRFAVPSTPRHARWLTMAEMERSALDRHGLSQRLASRQIATQQVAAWTDRRNQAAVTINWRLTAEDASITRTHLSPSIPD